MNCRTACFLVVILVVTVKSHNNEANRSKSVNEDHFNILLNIYKTNPLRRSKIYNALYNKILSPRPDTAALARNFNSIESTKEKEVKTDLHLKQIEKVIHTSRRHATGITPPNYDVRNLHPEVFDDVTINTPSAPKTIKRVTDTLDGFEEILGHVDSNEIDPPEVGTGSNTKNHMNMVIFKNNSKVAKEVVNGTELNIIKSKEYLPKAYYVYETNDVSQKNVPFNEDMVIVL